MNCVFVMLYLTIIVKYNIVECLIYVIPSLIYKSFTSTNHRVCINNFHIQQIIKYTM